MRCHNRSSNFWVNSQEKLGRGRWANPDGRKVVRAISQPRKERASKNFINQIKPVKYRLKSKLVIRVRQPGSPDGGADFPRSWEEETFVPALVRRKGGLISKISALKSRREPPIGSCRETVAGGRKQPEGKTGGRLFNGPPCGRDAVKNQNPRKG